MKRIKSADHTTGCIIHCHIPSTNETIYWFRVYDYNNRQPDNSVPFVDYQILHHDVFVKIDDETAAFFEHDGEFYLDHDMGV